MSYSYEYIIIGAGIGGLYTAFMLNHVFNITNILIIEKSNKIGGRVSTEHIIHNGITFDIDLGAGRVPNNQKHIINLIKFLGLESKLTEGKESKKLYLNKNEFTSIDDHSRFYEIINEMKTKINSDEHFKILANNYSFYRLLEREYDTETADLIKNQFGYSGDIIYQNSLKTIEMFDNEFSSHGKFSSLSGGLSQITHGMYDILIKKGINFMFETELEDIEKSNNKFRCKLTNKFNNVFCGHLILAIPKLSLMKIHYLDRLEDKLDSVINKPLIRVYAFFPTVDGKSWFDDIDATIITSTLMRQIIPIDPKNGYILLCYSDTEAADALHYLDKSDLLEDELMVHLKKLFPNKQIPNPEKLIVKYWQTATHVWLPSYDIKEINNDMIKPYKDDELFIVGEVFSLTHDWMEGALLTANKLIKFLYERTNKQNKQSE